MTGRTCQHCGQALAPTAQFCRGCGARYETPERAPEAPAATRPMPEASPTERRPTPHTPHPRSRLPMLAAALIVLVGIGAAAAILLTSGGGSATTTTVVERSATTTAAPVTAASREDADSEAADRTTLEAGEYIQAGSFKVVADAESEQQRLAAAGIETTVVSSTATQELYPGFQVLVAGPFRGGNEQGLLRDLHRHGVPSAFARELTPARTIEGPQVAGDWHGELEEISSSHPNLNRSLKVTVELSPDGRRGSIEVAKLGCGVGLVASGPEAAQSLEFEQDDTCLGDGSWQLRLASGSLMVALLPHDSDLIFLGTLDVA